MGWMAGRTGSTRVARDGEQERECGSEWPVPAVKQKITSMVEVSYVGQLGGTNGPGSSEAKAQVLLPHGCQQGRVHKPGHLPRCPGEPLLPWPTALLLLRRAARAPVLLYRPLRHAARRWQRQEVAAAAPAPRPTHFPLWHDVLVSLVGHDVQVAMLARLGCFQGLWVGRRALLPRVLEPALRMVGPGEVQAAGGCWSASG